MWRTNRHLAIATLLATTVLVDHAQASAVQSYLYTTSGDIAGISGVNNGGYPITYTPTSGTGMLTTPGTFNLGTITTSPLPTGATLNFDGTPFTINVGVGPVTSSSGYDNPYNYGSSFSYYYLNPTYTYTIHGTLNGSLQGDGTSTLFPTVTSITGSGSTPPFDASALLLNVQGIAAPMGSTFGTTTLTAHVDVTGLSLPSPAPEPTSVALFASALAGWAWRTRQVRSRRTAPAPV